ncbi:hypothetical protein BD309DRAFT_966093 [Dichomitus squalens]|uniref:Uncharacterized protein n=1 Tax=Dichomitus squalens TaxID=114155 RepID=A0A4Q9Q2T1_9APHY|nr:hypothetical protein BD309DRAFT_966093 [Dichomitus squalens]TBU61563.1 hypothetical protein BD310DRAFT_920261 [Dichomitus squalens]
MVGQAFRRDFMKQAGVHGIDAELWPKEALWMRHKPVLSLLAPLLSPGVGSAARGPTLLEVQTPSATHSHPSYLLRSPARTGCEARHPCNCQVPYPALRSLPEGLDGTITPHINLWDRAALAAVSCSLNPRCGSCSSSPQIRQM